MFIGPTCLSVAATLVSFLQPSSDVRQLVVFDFLPGRSSEAIAIFRDEALPLYRDNAPMLRFRGLREVESPLPLDLVVVSSFDGMAGMDASNRALREAAQEHGTSIGALYGRIGALSDAHWDSFVEMDPELGWGGRDEGPLVVLESLRLTPGAAARFDTLVAGAVLAWERESRILLGGETGRYLIADGFDVLRIYSIASLGDWHRYLTARDEAPFARDLDAITAVSQRIIVAPVEELAVR